MIPGRFATQILHKADSNLKMYAINIKAKGNTSQHSRPPIMSGTSLCPHATQAIFGKVGTDLPCFFFLGTCGTTEKEGMSVAGFVVAGFGAAGLRTRLGFMVSACVGRIDFRAYGRAADCDTSVHI